MANFAQFSFQDAVSPIISQLIAFHDHALLVIILVIRIIGYAFVSLIKNSLTSRYLLEAQQIEIIWTILPAFTLLFLAFPSLHLLYLIDEIAKPNITIKAVGHQWYWSYEYGDFPQLEFDSYITQESDLNPGEYRLLEVDHRTVAPINAQVRVIVTAADVIHSWAVPSLGLKADAVPGRLNQVGFSASRPGVFYGQCSEICGANHSFIPIALEIVDTQSFLKWAINNSSNWSFS